MSETAPYPTIAGATRTGNYTGVESAPSYGDTPGELKALQAGCGLLTLDWRIKVSVSGKDRARWLHNMVTNNVRDLPLNRGNYNFVLNAQGRILGDLYIYNLGEFLALDTDSMQRELVFTTMKRFIIMDKVELSALPLAAIAICGPKAQEVLRASGLDADGMDPLEVRPQVFADRQVTLVKGPRNKPGWFEVWTAEADLAPLGELLLRCGAHPVGTDALEQWRVLHGIPQYGRDIRDRDLPQETGQTQALNYTKGCYIGQEIVERIRSRGQVHRKFTGFEFTGGRPELKKYEAEGRAVAEITSTATVAAASGDRHLGLGYVRREIAESNQHLDLEGTKARLVDLPFEI